MPPKQINNRKVNPIAGIPTRRKPRRRNNKPKRLRRGAKRMPMLNCSADGQAFLRCAFAPPDFSMESVAGVPDTFTGQTLIKKHRYTSSLQFGAGTDTYLLLTGTPGVAYWEVNTAIGAGFLATTAMNANNYADYSSLFGTLGQEANQVTKFRTISQAVEITPTVNEMTWTGSITAWKAPVTQLLRTGTASFDYSVTGLQSMNANTNSQFVGSFKDGIYMLSGNAEPDFEFKNILENQSKMPVATGVPDFGQLVGAPSVPGLSDLEAIIIKISIPAGSPNMTAVMRVWACVEYQVNPSSVLIEYTRSSPAYDPIALAKYREVLKQLPIAVTCKDNVSFWEFVKRILSSSSAIAGVASAFPGPYGQAAGGYSTMAAALASLI